MRGLLGGLGRRGSAAMEMALTFPSVLLLVFGFFAAFSLVMAQRAMDVGLERALRYAAVNSSGGTSGVTSAYTAWAGRIWRDVGVRSSVSVTGTLAAGNTVTVNVSYVWAAPTFLNAPDNNAMFTGVTLTTSGQVLVMH